MQAKFTFKSYSPLLLQMNKKEKFLLDIITTNSREAVIIHSQTIDICTAEMALVIKGKIYTVHHTFTGYNIDTRMLAAHLKIVHTAVMRVRQPALSMV